MAEEDILANASPSTVSACFRISFGKQKVWSSTVSSQRNSCKGKSYDWDRVKSDMKAEAIYDLSIVQRHYGRFSDISQVKMIALTTEIMKVENLR